MFGFNLKEILQKTIKEIAHIGDEISKNPYNDGVTLPVYEPKENTGKTKNNKNIQP